MSTYSISLIPLSALDFYGKQPDDYQFQAGSGSGWDWGTYHFTFDSSTVIEVTVDDEDDTLQDDPSNPEWSGSDHTAHTQVTDGDITVDGTTYASGLRIEDEYELYVTDQQGNVYRLVAISVDSDPSNPYSGSTVIGYTFEGEWPPEDAKLTIVRGSGEDGQELSAPVCFTEGTLIRTPLGDRPVESLRRGDHVTTLDHGPLPMRLMVARRLGAEALERAPNLRPIRIAAGALAPGMPSHDLLVSQQHRILIASRVTRRMFSDTEVLVAAKHLVGAPGITVAEDLAEVTYFHFLFDAHQIVTANGAPCESLYTGPQALRSVPPAAREEILTLFPELAEQPDVLPDPARPLVPPKRARRMSMRHRKNRRRSFLEAAPTR